MDCLPGVNLPVFRGAVGYDLAPNAFLGTGPREVDPMHVYRPLLEAREIGFQAVRVWLCERGEGILMDGASITGVSPVLIESVAIIQECASLCGLKIYWTLLDAQAGRADDHDWLSRAVLTESDHAARFAERVIAPLARRFDPGVTFAVEIVNEPDALIDARRDAGGEQWRVLGAHIKMGVAAVHAEQPGAIVTTGVQRAALPGLWHSGAGLTAVDVHVDAGAPLPSRSELAVELGDPAICHASLPVMAGRCAITSAGESDVHRTLARATREAYAAVFFWRLEGELVDVAPGKRQATPLADGVKAALGSAARRSHP